MLKNEKVSLNAMSFTGSIFVRRQEHIRWWVRPSRWFC